MDKCSHCGYSDCFAAIDFHHVKPETKEFYMAYAFKRKPNNKYLEELSKCVALCSNCHRKLHHEGEL